MSYILVLLAGVIIGIVVTRLLQVNKVNVSEIRKRELIDYMHMYASTNSKGKTEYDKGYADALEYASVLIEEELQ